MSEQVTVIGVFEDSKMAERAIQELRQSGFSEEQLGLAVPAESQVGRDAAVSEAETKTQAEGGGVAQRIVGGVLGAIDLLLLPIMGPTEAERAFETTLPAAEEAIDDIRGASDRGGRSEDVERHPSGNPVRETAMPAAYYKREFESGRTIVTVKAAGREQEVLDLLRRNGARDVQAHASTT